MCVCVCVHSDALPITSYSRLLLIPSNQLCAFALLLFANVIRPRPGYSSLLAPLAQSELLICFSVRMTFVRAQHPRPASQNQYSLKKHSAGQQKDIRQLETTITVIRSYLLFLSSQTSPIL